jgi:outer membrane lipoprotein SlyB
MPSFGEPSPHIEVEKTMEINPSLKRIHPLIAAAAISVIVVSGVGIAAITGILPNSHGNDSPKQETQALVSDKTPAAQEPVTQNVKQQSKLLGETDAATVKRSAQAPVRSHAPRPTKTAQADYRESTRTTRAPVCYECGRIESVTTVQSQSAPTGVGMVAGGVIGGLLGNQVGGGNGKKLMTVAGAVGGGYAGHEIEKSRSTHTTYQVRVRMEDGTLRTFPFNNAPQWNTGDRIRVVDGYLQARG